MGFEVEDCDAMGEGGWMRKMLTSATRAAKWFVVLIQINSTQVRVAYHFWSVAMNDSYSVPLRAMAGAFFWLCVCVRFGL